MSDTHILIRTSPKGGPFIGYCTKCGAQNLPVFAMGKACPVKTTDAAVIAAIVGKEPPR